MDSKSSLTDFLRSCGSESRPATDPPKPIVDADADSIFFCTSKEPFFAERVDDLLTVYRSIETNAVIGIQLKGISGLPQFKTVHVDIVSDDPVKYVINLLLSGLVVETVDNVDTRWLPAIHWAVSHQASAA